MDEKNVQKLIKHLLKEIGENPERSGLLETPKRVANMYKELFRGYDSKKKPKITTFMNGEDGLTYDQMIIDEGGFYSHCEHHMVPFFGQYWFAYIPNPRGKIMGLSKVARIVDYYAARLQIQERLVQEVVEELWDALSIRNDDFPAIEPLGMALVLKGKHLCKSMRGAKKEGWMTTIDLRGAMRDDNNARLEFLKFVNGDHR